MFFGHYTLQRNRYKKCCCYLPPFRDGTWRKTVEPQKPGNSSRSGADFVYRKGVKENGTVLRDHSWTGHNERSARSRMIADVEAQVSRWIPSGPMCRRTLIRQFAVSPIEEMKLHGIVDGLSSANHRACHCSSEMSERTHSSQIEKKNKRRKGRGLILKITRAAPLRAFTERCRKKIFGLVSAQGIWDSQRDRQLFRPNPTASGAAPPRDHGC